MQSIAQSAKLQQEIADEIINNIFRKLKEAVWLPKQREFWLDKIAMCLEEKK